MFNEAQNEFDRNVRKMAESNLLIDMEIEILKSKVCSQKYPSCTWYGLGS